MLPYFSIVQSVCQNCLLAISADEYRVEDQLTFADFLQVGSFPLMQAVVALKPQ